MFDTSSYVTIVCSECGSAAEDMPAEEWWFAPGELPEYRHVADRTALCPVRTRGGYRPTEPVEDRDEQR